MSQTAPWTILVWDTLRKQWQQWGSYFTHDWEQANYDAVEASLETGFAPTRVVRLPDYTDLPRRPHARDCRKSSA